MAKKEAYEHFSTLSEKLAHLLKIHGSKKTRHFSNYEVELLDEVIQIVKLNESDQESNQRKPSDQSRNLQHEKVLKQRVIILLDEGNSNTVISKAIGITKAVVGKWKKEYICSLFRKGNSAKKISSTYSLNYSIATKWRRETLGITTVDSKSTIKGVNARAAKKEKRSDAAKKGAQTKAANKKRRSDAAKKGAQTRATNKIKPKRNKRPRYSAKLQSEAMRLIRENRSSAEVSQILGITKYRILKWRKKHGLVEATKTHPIAFQNDVLDQIREGKSNSEIAKATGVSSTTVDNWRKEFEKEGF